MQFKESVLCPEKRKIIVFRCRYALQGSRWRTRDLTYRITKYPGTNRLSKDEVDRQIKEAFQLWEDETNLSFQRRER